jgi:hypothetical protein
LACWTLARGQPRDVAAAVGGLCEQIHPALPVRAEEELAVIAPDRKVSTAGPRVARLNDGRAGFSSQMSIS